MDKFLEAAIEEAKKGLAEGGILCFNDYGLNQFPGPTEAIDEVLETFKPNIFFKLPTGGAFLTCSHSKPAACRP